MFMLRSTCLCAPCHVNAQIYLLMCSLPCFCVQIYMLVVMPCASIAFLSLDISLSCALALLGRVQIQILWSRPTSYTQTYIKGFGLFPLCMCMLACFYALYPCLPVQIQALPCFVPPMGLCLYGCICSSYGLFECNHLGEHIPVMLVCLMHTLFPLRVMLCLPCLLYATRLAFFTSLHLYTFSNMFIHESLLIKPNSYYLMRVHTRL